MLSKIEDDALIKITSWFGEENVISLEDFL
jgi:hypothetical protein